MNISIKCILTFFILIFLTDSTKGQLSLYPEFRLDAQVLLYKRQELLNLKVLVKKSFDGTVDEYSFNDFLYYHKDGEKVSFPIGQIEHLEFTDFDGKKRIFISSRYTGIKNARGLWEIMYLGRITWYREFYYKYPHGMSRRDFFVKQNEEPVFYGFKGKKKLMALTIDQPELVAKIKAIKTDEDLLQILKLYNAQKISFSG